MAGEVILLLAGTALLVVAALGGRTRITAIAARRTARTVGAAAGLLCLAAAMLMRGGDHGGATAGPVSIQITNQLGAGQLSEEIRVTLGEREVGVVRVNRQSPTARLIANVTDNGRIGYRLESKRRLVGVAAVDARTSTGDFVVDGQTRLGVYSDDKGRMYLLRER